MGRIIAGPMMDWLKTLLPEGPLRWRLGFGVLLAMLAGLLALIGPMAQSLAMSAEAAVLGVAAVALLVDPQIRRLAGDRRELALLVRDGAVTLAAGWTGLQTVLGCFTKDVPAPEAMASLGVMAVALNLAIFGMIPVKEADADLRAARLRGRSDLLGSVALLLAAGIVALTQSKAADLVVAAVLVMLVLTASLPRLIAAMRTVQGLAAQRARKPETWP